MKDPKLTVRLPEPVIRTFKSRLAKNGLTVQEILEKAVMDYLRGKSTV